MKKDRYVKAMNNINLSQEAQIRIMNKAINYNMKKENIKMSKKKIAVIAVAATMVMGVAAYAASGVISMWCGSSSSIPDYKEFPTTKQVVKDIGYSPILIEGFSNGYTFEDGSIVSNSLKDETGKRVEKFKSVCFRYNNGIDEVLLSAEQYSSEMDTSGEVMDTVNGIELLYNQYTNKAVPVDYVLTDEDKKAEQEGSLVFSYGADDVSVSEVKGLSWETDGIHYRLTQIDGKLTQDDMVSMAKEMINR